MSQVIAASLWLSIEFPFHALTNLLCRRVRPKPMPLAEVVLCRFLCLERPFFWHKAQVDSLDQLKIEALSQF
jgi:hypothetical protein